MFPKKWIEVVKRKLRTEPLNQGRNIFSKNNLQLLSAYCVPDIVLSQPFHSLVHLIFTLTYNKYAVLPIF